MICCTVYQRTTIRYTGTVNNCIVRASEVSKKSRATSGSNYFLLSPIEHINNEVRFWSKLKDKYHSKVELYHIDLKRDIRVFRELYYDKKNNLSILINRLELIKLRGDQLSKEKQHLYNEVYGYINSGIKTIYDILNLLKGELDVYKRIFRSEINSGVRILSSIENEDYYHSDLGKLQLSSFEDHIKELKMARNETLKVYAFGDIKEITELCEVLDTLGIKSNMNSVKNVKGEVEATSLQLIDSDLQKVNVLSVLSVIFPKKYGKQFAAACKAVSEKVNNVFGKAFNVILKAEYLSLETLKQYKMLFTEFGVEIPDNVNKKIDILKAEIKRQMTVDLESVDTI